MIDLVLPDHRRGDHFVARLRPDRILGVQCRTPTASCRSALRSCAPSHRPRRSPPAPRRRSCRPRAKTTARAGSARPRLFFPHQLARLLVHRDDGRRPRRRNVHMALILAVGRADEDQVAVGNRRRVGHVVRLRANLLHHVELPDAPWRRRCRRPAYPGRPARSDW